MSGVSNKRYIIISIAIWVLAFLSLIGARFILHKKRSPALPVAEAQAIISGLDPHQKESLKYYDAGLIRLADDSFHLVGNCPDSDEVSLIASQKASIRNIDFRIRNQLLLERQTMVREAIKTLNTAEKRCLFEGFAAIFFRSGAYHLIYDKEKYAEYVLKYGTECKTCDEANEQFN